MPLPLVCLSKTGDLSHVFSSATQPSTFEPHMGSHHEVESPRQPVQSSLLFFAPPERGVSCPKSGERRHLFSWHSILVSGREHSNNEPAPWWINFGTFHEFRVTDSCLASPPQSCPLNSRSQIEKPPRVPHELAQPGRCRSRPCRGWRWGARLRGKVRV